MVCSKNKDKKNQKLHRRNIMSTPSPLKKIQISYLDKLIKRKNLDSELWILDSSTRVRSTYPCVLMPLHI